MSLAFSRTSGRLDAIAATAALTAAVFVLPAKAAELDAKGVLTTYADIALAKYQDLLTTAQALDKAVDALIASTLVETLKAARDAWKASRIPYQQTEVYRFGNKIVDDWEGQVNSWPLDEGLIDYVAASYGTESRRERALRRQCHRQHVDQINGKKSTPRRSPGAARRQAAGGRRRRGQCRDRLSRHRVSALGPGPERHRPRRRRSPGHRLRHSRTAPAAIATGAPQYLKAATDLLVDDLPGWRRNWAPDGAARKTARGEPTRRV